ncbi:hypothetical protein N802_11610 [Knoellia sinensis KCTC 19936]|uniref:Uncharacterized protein n=1 Tax=Knoellia sinensis KCTC 19936 TaxID=1385520 RepID=A0A0A0IZ19_9MICO|nr:hypothetical protein [Knoellia sinensis]KGN29734.1 hypothetical protein N802_11610 [Knoellia sinensis KCTC 19936]
MADDEKLAFYLRHREQIEEWANLRSTAEAVLDSRLRGAARQLVHELPSAGVIAERRWGYEHIFIPADAREPRVGMGLAWKKKGVVNAGATLALTCLDGTKDARYRALKAATQSVALTHGLERFGSSEWLWMTHLRPAPDLVDLGEFADYCVQQLHDAWTEFRPQMLAAMPDPLEVPDPAGGIGRHQL